MTTHETDGTVVVHLSGDFDLIAVEPFGVEVDRAAAMAGERVVIDLRDLAFIDSSGLRSVLAAHQKLAAAGASVKFLRPPDRLWRVFTVTGTDKLLPFDAALTAEAGRSRREDRA